MASVKNLVDRHTNTDLNLISKGSLARCSQQMSAGTRHLRKLTRPDITGGWQMERKVSLFWQCPVHLANSFVYSGSWKCGIPSPLRL